MKFIRVLKASDKLNFGGYAYFARKPKDLEDLKTTKMISSEPYVLLDTVNVSEDEFDELTSNFYNDKGWSLISNKWDNAYDNSYDIELGDDFFYVIKLSCPNRPSLLLDFEGATYPRYVAIEK